MLKLILAQKAFSIFVGGEYFAHMIKKRSDSSVAVIHLVHKTRVLLRGGLAGSLSERFLLDRLAWRQKPK